MMEEDNSMPVIIFWAVPAVILIGGGIVLLGHLH